MKYFLDTEFIEKPNMIDLISIGIISENDDTFYGESINWDISQCNDWIKENVIPHLKWRNDFDDSVQKINSCKKFTHVSKAKVWSCFGENSYIGKVMNEFISDTCDSEKIEFYGYYADYDWVVFCWLFGKMIDLPEGFPKYCKDVKQMIDEKGNPKKPKQISGEHDALADAIYHKYLYNWVSNLK